MTRLIALTAPTALGLPAAPVHEPVHARHFKSLPSVVSIIPDAQRATLAAGPVGGG